MTVNIFTFGVRGVDADADRNGNQQLNGDAGLNELTADNLINTDGLPFQQLLLFVGEANDGDLSLDAGETAFNLSDMAADDSVVSLAITNTNDPIRIRAHGLISNNTLGDLTSGVRFDNTQGFGLKNAFDGNSTASWLNGGDSLTFEAAALNNVNQYLTSVSFVVNVNGGGAEHVIIDFDGDVVRQSGAGTVVDGIDLGAVANGTTVSINFAARTISIGAATRAMTDAEYTLFLQSGLNQITVGSLNTSTQGFAIGSLTILTTDAAVSGNVIHAPSDGGETNGTANDDVIIGSSAADILNGDAGDDVIFGGAGNDIITTGGGANHVVAGDGDDTIQVQIDGAPDVIDGGAGFDKAFLQTGDAGGYYVISPYTIDGVTYAGIDAQATAGIEVSSREVEEIVIIGGAGADTVIVQGDLSTAGVAQHTIIFYGGAGDDVYDASLEDGLVSGEIYGEAGNDTLTGGAGNDLLDGGSGVDNLHGGGGDDVLVVGGNGVATLAGETYDGGAGVDTLRVDAGHLTPTGAHQVSFVSSTVTSIERLEFGDTVAGDNQIVFTTFQLGGGLANNATIVGSENQDTLVLAAIFSGTYSLAVTSYTFENWSSNDRVTLFGVLSTSNYTFIGSSGDDVLVGNAGIDNLQGGAGHDVLAGNAGDDSMNGGGGIDTVSYASAVGPVAVELSIVGVAQDTLSAGLDTLSEIENVTGSAFDDEIIGDNIDNVLEGLSGHDLILGLGGNDTIFGGAGNDFLRGDGFPAYAGPSGDDTLFGGAGDDVMWGGAGVDFFDGGDGFDRVSFAFRAATEAVHADLNDQIVYNDGFGNMEALVSIEALGTGTQFADTLIGNDLANFLSGDVDDTLMGNGGGDLFSLGGAPLVLDGGAGVDTILQFYGAVFGAFTSDNNSDGLADIVYADHGVTVDMRVNSIVDDGFGNSGAFTSIENVGGSELADVINGDGYNNTLIGYGDADSLFGEGGDDVLNGGLGDDFMDGGTGVNTVSYASEVNFGPVGTYTFEERSEGVVVDLTTGTGGAISGGETDTLVNIDNVQGTDFDDFIIGDIFNNVLTGFGGADTLTGGAGDDSFVFHAGQSDGDIVTDFTGNGAAFGDMLLFEGYGTVAAGATFVQIDATHWQINSADGLIHDIIAIANGASVDPTDFIFGGG